MRLILLSVLLAVCAYGQMPSGSATTSGPCSPAVPGSNNRFVINCPGMSGEQFNRLLEILNRIARDRLDPKVVMAALEDIKKGIDQIREKQSPRELDLRQKETLKEMLRGHPQKVMVEVLANDKEAAEFGDKLSKALGESGWDAGFVFAVLTPFSGLTIIVRDAQFPEAALLQQALRAVGIEAGGSLDPSMGPGQIILRVGSKP